jgi:hypothetical protein
LGFSSNDSLQSPRPRSSAFLADRSGDGGTAAPTLPSTSTLDGQGTDPTDGWRMILLAMAGVLAAALLLTPARAVVRKDDRSR